MGVAWLKTVTFADHEGNCNCTRIFEELSPKTRTILVNGHEEGSLKSTLIWNQNTCTCTFGVADVYGRRWLLTIRYSFTIRLLVCPLFHTKKNIDFWRRRLRYTRSTVAVLWLITIVTMMLQNKVLLEMDLPTSVAKYPVIINL